MKITRFAHACILVEQDGVNVLFDPGNYSTELLNRASLPKLDYIVVTHEHPDHFDLAQVKKLASQNPELKIISTEPVVKQLAGAGLPATTDVSGPLTLFTAPHEPTPFGPSSANIGVHFGEFSHPGDSHSFSETKKVLALPTAGPWASLKDAVSLAEKLKPAYVVPIHDFPSRPEYSQGIYQRLKSFLEPQGITVLIPVDGQAIEI